MNASGISPSICARRRFGSGTLATGRERFARAIDALDDGIVIVDEMGTIVARNRAAEKYVGARHAVAIAEDEINRVTSAALAGSSCTRELSLFGPPRQVLLLRAEPLWHHDKVAGAVVWARDVSEARRVDDVRRDFVANVSHELRTPIGALALLAETVSDEDDPAVQRRFAEQMVREAERLARIVDDLLDLSVIETNEAAQLEPLGIAAVVRDALEQVRGAADVAGIAIHVADIASDLVVTGDRRQLVSALYNLLDNAVKYSERGASIDIMADKDAERRDGCSARPRHRHPHEGSRADLRALLPSRPRAAARPEAPVSGSRSCATSPQRTAAISPSSRTKAKARRSRSDSPWRLNRRTQRERGMTDAPLILVVDDEQSYRDALSVALQREGFLVVTAADGEEALDRFYDTKPALVLLDVMLPKISGIDVCRDIRTHSRTPIIMVTARNAEIDAVVGLEVGADDYVSKPFRLRELIARVRASLRRTPGDDETGERPEMIEVGDVRIDTGRHEVFVRDEATPLPLKEFELLEMLLVNAGRVLTRDVLIDRVWGPNYFGDTKTLDVHIKRLRAKVEVDPSTPQQIVTVRGVGYRFERPREARAS